MIALKQMLNMWHWTTIRRGSRIQSSVVITGPPRIIRLLHHVQRRWPAAVGWLDDSLLHKLLELLLGHSSGLSWRERENTELELPVSMKSSTPDEKESWNWMGFKTLLNSLRSWETSNWACGIERMGANDLYALGRHWAVSSVTSSLIVIFAQLTERLWAARKSAPMIGCGMSATMKYQSNCLLAIDSCPSPCTVTD